MPRRFLWVLVAGALIAWLGAAAVTGPFAGKLSQVQSNDQATFLPQSAESTRVAALEKKFDTGHTLPALIVLVREAGLEGRDLGWAENLAAGLPGDPARPIRSRDGKALQIIVSVQEGGASGVRDAVTAIRDHLQRDRPDGLKAYVTGPAGLTADLGEAFSGIDGVLLLVALVVVLLILVIVYRSPILPLAVLLSTVFALALASGAVYLLAENDVVTLNGQTQGILSILVVGAATDYALLYVARYREELREHRSRLEATRVALRQSFEPILASGLTVILALLCLLASDLNSTRSLGPVAALGITASLLSALTFLPALLALFGRAAFWPTRPAYGSEHPERSGFWGKVAVVVAARPRRLWVGTALVLAGLAALSPTINASGTPQSQVFLHEVESVTGQRVAAEHFPGGTASPAIVIGPAQDERAIVIAARAVDGVASIGRGLRNDGLVRVQVVLKDPYDSSAARDTIVELRSAVHEKAPAAEVGGQTAVDLDTLATAERDRELVIPLVLLVVLVLLALLLRSLLAAALLLATVVLSYAATIGVAAVLFNHVLGLPPADPSVPLYGFIFLVALGVDYNIFLMSRVREESKLHGTRQGVQRGLRVTGGVITSAGVVLAATFSALWVIPLVFLAQVAFIVAFGVLLDALVVRSVLVPAAALDLGHRLWWPSRLDADR
jgi:putative drug exporter of the RND superfamily